MTNADRLAPYRWVKGQSGNPGGRPKKAHSRAVILAKILDRVLAGEDPMTGGDIECSVYEHMVLKQVEKAIKNGDTSAFHALSDSRWGKVPNAELEQEEVEPIKGISFDSEINADDFKVKL